jgi:hypothetical protein
VRRELPPLLGRILSATLPRDKGPFIYGDLLEEYDDRASRSPPAASRWLRRQVLASVPRFLWQRAVAVGIAQLVVLIGSTLLACLAILAWESQVARQVARLASEHVAGAPHAVRTLYVLVQAVAFTVVGVVLARCTFDRGQSFLRNAAFRLTPFAAIIFLPAFAARLTGEAGYSWWFLVPWALTLSVALLAGARIASRR